MSITRKFRGKRKDNGEWVEGYLLEQNTPEYHCYIVISFRAEQDNRHTDILECDIYEVIPETVGQHTGLTDKNVKEIFEGDVVESKFTKKPYLICFGEYTYTDEDGEESVAYGWYNEEKCGYVTAFSQPDCWATVIGNIHDNPELLKGGAE